MPSHDITVVVPVFNEQDSLRPLVEEIHQACEPHDWRVRILFVDDGSQDGSWATILEMVDRDALIAGLRFRKNAGKAAALMAGFAAAEGDLVFMMDADLQDPPAEMPRFVESIEAGYDMVSGWKKRRLDPWHKTYPSRVFNKIIGWVTGVRLHDHVCGYKCFRRDVLDHIRIYGEFHRFLGVFAADAGFRVTEIATQHRPRTTGKGKYGLSRFAKGFIDLLGVALLTRFRYRPQHFAGVLGLYIFVLSVIIGFLGFGNVFLPSPLGETVSVVWHFVLMILSAILDWALLPLVLIAIGLNGLLILDRRPMDDLYTISERIGWVGEPISADSAESASAPAGSR